MDEAHNDRLETARLKALVAETGLRVCELAVLLSTFKAIAEGEALEERGVPREERPGVPDPAALWAREEDMTTKEAVDILSDWLDMSAEGEARLWRLLSLGAELLEE
jgi:hypothetical protein